jgi:hypothetical protein
MRPRRLPRLLFRREVRRTLKLPQEIEQQQHALESRLRCTELLPVEAIRSGSPFGLPNRWAFFAFFPDDGKHEPFMVHCIK